MSNLCMIILHTAYNVKASSSLFEINDLSPGPWRCVYPGKLGFNVLSISYHLKHLHNFISPNEPTCPLNLPYRQHTCTIHCWIHKMTTTCPILMSIVLRFIGSFVLKIIPFFKILHQFHTWFIIKYLLTLLKWPNEATKTIINIWYFIYYPVVHGAGMSSDCLDFPNHVSTGALQTSVRR